MRRVPPPGGGMWLDHVWWPDVTAPEYLAAREEFEQRQRVRRARIMARIAAERGEVLSFPGDGGVPVGPEDYAPRSSEAAPGLDDDPEIGDPGRYVPSRPPRISGC